MHRVRVLRGSHLRSFYTSTTQHYYHNYLLQQASLNPDLLQYNVIHQDDTQDLKYGQPLHRKLYPYPLTVLLLTFSVGRTLPPPRLTITSLAF